jgi:hypothetical protein
LAQQADYDPQLRYVPPCLREALSASAALRASVRLHGRAQGDGSTLRPIRHQGALGTRKARKVPRPYVKFGGKWHPFFTAICRPACRRVLMGLEALFPQPRTATGAPGACIYLYLLRDRVLTHADEVWSSDITYVPMRHGFMYLTAARGSSATGIPAMTSDMIRVLKGNRTVSQ